MAVKPIRTVLTRVPAIERIRATLGRTNDRLDLVTVRSIVDGIKAALPLSAIATTAKMTEPAVLDLVAELGTWLVHVHGGASTDEKIVVAADQAQPSLFYDPGDGIVVPLGFERRKGLRRDLTKSIAALVRNAPDDAELSRWLDRKYPSTVGVLTADDIHTIKTIARIGRLNELDLVSTSPAYNQVIVAAFDLLDVALCDALGGMADLVRMSQPDAEIDLDLVESAATKIAWMNEGRMARVSALANLARESGNTSALRHNLETFAHEVRNSPQWRPTTIAKLEDGQILRLIERSGLAEPPDARKTETALRKKLIALGLRNDVDRLLPDALRAVRAKLEDEFWTAIDARLGGDPEWRIPFEEALSTYNDPA
jgi:hypothetical protein